MTEHCTRFIKQRIPWTLNQSYKYQSWYLLVFPPPLFLLAVLFWSVSAIVQKVIKISDQSKTLAQKRNIFVLLWRKATLLPVKYRVDFSSLVSGSTQQRSRTASCTWQLLCRLCAACYMLTVLRCETYLQVRRTAAGRCCNPMWWWTTASPHGCTRSPWKRNTWTHSPPLLVKTDKGGKI